MPAKYSPEKRLEKFWSRVDKSGECWEWTAGRNDKSPYGVVRWDGHNEFTHRVSWMLMNGPIPNGQKVLHKCDNHPCVNPAHLFLGDQHQNVMDAVQKGRWPGRGGRPAKTTCHVGHPMTRDRSNHSYCAECTRARSQRYAEAKRFGERSKGK